MNEKEFRNFARLRLVNFRIGTLSSGILHISVHFPDIFYDIPDILAAISGHLFSVGYAEHVFSSNLYSKTLSLEDELFGGRNF